MEPNVATQVAPNEEPPIDYEAEYKKVLSERDSARAEAEKYKGLKDKYAGESAEYKRKIEAQMSDEEKRQAENAEREQRYMALQSEVNEMRTATAFAKAGFDEKDYGNIVKKIVEVGGEKSGELANTLIEFVKKSNASAVANAKNIGIVETAKAMSPKASTTQGAKSDYQLYQENKTKTNNIVEL